MHVCMHRRRAKPPAWAAPTAQRPPSAPPKGSPSKGSPSIGSLSRACTQHLRMRVTRVGLTPPRARRARPQGSGARSPRRAARVAGRPALSRREQVPHPAVLLAQHLLCRARVAGRRAKVEDVDPHRRRVLAQEGRRRDARVGALRLATRVRARALPEQVLRVGLQVPLRTATVHPALVPRLPGRCATLAADRIEVGDAPSRDLVGCCQRQGVGSPRGGAPSRRRH